LWVNGLELALACSAFAFGLLAGIFCGFRVVTRDAGLIGALDRRVAQALSQSSAAKADADRLTETWAEYLADAERKRAKASAERQRVERAEQKGAEQSAAPSLDELDPRERRRALARGMRAAS
jgi:hypothetical protein